MKKKSIITLIFISLFSFTVIGEEVTLSQSDVRKISSDAKKQISSEKKQKKKGTKRKSSNKKKGREKISKRERREILTGFNPPAFRRSRLNFNVYHFIITEVLLCSCIPVTCMMLTG